MGNYFKENLAKFGYKLDMKYNFCNQSLYFTRVNLVKNAPPRAEKTHKKKKKTKGWEI